MAVATAAVRGGPSCDHEVPVRAKTNAPPALLAPPAGRELRCADDHVVGRGVHCHGVTEGVCRCSWRGDQPGLFRPHRALAVIDPRATEATQVQIGPDHQATSVGSDGHRATEAISAIEPDRRRQLLLELPHAGIADEDEHLAHVHLCSHVAQEGADDGASPIGGRVQEGAEAIVSLRRRRCERLVFDHDQRIDGERIDGAPIVDDDDDSLVGRLEVSADGPPSRIERHQLPVPCAGLAVAQRDRVRSDRHDVHSDQGDVRAQRARTTDSTSQREPVLETGIGSAPPLVDPGSAVDHGPCG